MGISFSLFPNHGRSSSWGYPTHTYWSNPGYSGPTTIIYEEDRNRQNYSPNRRNNNGSLTRSNRNNNNGSFTQSNKNNNYTPDVNNTVANTQYDTYNSGSNGSYSSGGKLRKNHKTRKNKQGNRK